MTQRIPDPAAIVWRSGSMRAVLSAVLALVVALLAGGVLIGAAAAVFSDMGGISRFVAALVLLLLAAFLGGLAHYLWRNARGFWRGWVSADGEGIAYRLPRDRSLVHRPPAAEGSLGWSAVERLESRLEAYRSQLLAMVQRTYWLVPRAGDRLLLFEDRGLATVFAIRKGEAAFDRLAALGAVPMVEAAMVEGRGGLLGAWLTGAPARNAPPLDEAAGKALWRRAAFTGRIAGMATTIVLAAMVLARFVGG